MISYTDALQIIRTTASAKQLATEKISLADALGRVCAEDLKVPLDIQPFDNAAMDGFAVCLSDLAAASPTNPVRLKKVGIISAGQNAANASIAPGSCWHVMTGAMIPAGTEAVVPIEDVILDDNDVLFKAQPPKDLHIRRTGQDFKKGTPIALKGARITPTHILPLATLGISHLIVFKKPRILFISTGTEVVEDLSAPLADGHIYNSTKPYALAFLTTCGADVTIAPTIRDDLDQFVTTLKAAEKDYDIIISSGAVSAGTYDFVKDGLEAVNATLLYHKIKLKPGKPNLFATLPSGALYFGIPGNPVSTAVGLRFFVIEALRAMQSQAPETPALANAATYFSRKPGLHLILKSRTKTGQDGSITVEILDGQESFMVSPFLSMNSWLHVPEEQATIDTDNMVHIYPFAPE